MARQALSYFTYSTAHGPMTIGATERGICAVSFSSDQFEGSRRATDITNAAATQLQEYLAGKRFGFDVPLDMIGSPFQKEVWIEVCQIPYGETRIAADIAKAIGKAGSHRSVGTAIRRNPIPVLIPTHRVELPNATGKTAKIFTIFTSPFQKVSIAHNLTSYYITH